MKTQGRNSVTRARVWTVLIIVFCALAAARSYAAPSISSISTVAASIGTSVTISGTGFGAPQGSSTVTFNGVAGTPTSWGATSIVVPVPAGASSGPIVVTVGGIASNSVQFSVVPHIATLSPTSAGVGMQFTITGTGFGATQATSSVSFYSAQVTASITAWSDTSISGTVPQNASTGSVWVTVGSSNASNGINFTLLTTPTITSLSPSSGPIGTWVTIAGSNFGSTQGSSTVTFNGVPVTTVA